MSGDKVGTHFNFESVDNNDTNDGTDYHVMDDNQPLPDETPTRGHGDDPEAMIQTPNIRHHHSRLDLTPPPELNVVISESNDGECNRQLKYTMQELISPDSDMYEDNYGQGDSHDVFSIASTILTEDGIADPVSFRVNCLIVFMGDMARGIFFPTMWNLVQKLGGDQVLLGYVIASFSFGRMLVLPLFGSWSIKHGYKWTLQISTLILLIGTILFAQALNVRKAWYLIVANTIVGVGSGTLGVTMAYASEVTPKRKRTGYLAWVASVQYAGTTATPFIGSFFVVLFAKDKEEDVRG